MNHVNHVCLDGRFIPSDTPVLLPTNHSYRYGDGLFETMRMVRGKIALVPLHFDRFFSSCQQLGYIINSHLTGDFLLEQITRLCEKNECADLARIRLSAYGGEGGLYDGDHSLHYLIECWPANNAVTVLNDNGLVIDVYPDARKSCDSLANLKSANFLPYVMAARFAKNNQLNDCIVLNTHQRIADTTIANLFVINKGKLITPPLSEGCVNGVLRRYLLEKTNVEETPLSPDDLQNADELFLTNAMNGIRWVKQFGNKSYGNDHTVNIYDSLVKTIWD